MAITEKLHRLSKHIHELPFYITFRLLLIIRIIYQLSGWEPSRRYAHSGIGNAWKSNGLIGQGRKVKLKWRPWTVFRTARLFPSGQLHWIFIDPINYWKWRGIFEREANTITNNYWKRRVKLGSHNIRGVWIEMRTGNWKKRQVEINVLGFWPK